ncbi:ComEA family DNA-binding protein [Candidatus Collierbacteria bacterium]|nr:ComEA family DNA-binding protein [Candidatus Collierbacteria bacterium]
MKLKLAALIKRFTWLDWVILALLLVFVIYFLVMIGLRSLKKPPTVEYLAKSGGSSEAKAVKEIWVDVSGAVVSPGVYKLAEGARVKDALVAAGGVSSVADRTILAKEVNLATVVTDGQKIYIREKSDGPPIGSGVTAGGQAGATTADKINLNTASLSELDSLWGVGEVRAGEIVKNRPYAKIEDLLTKKVITKSVFEKIKDQITIY